MWYNGLLSGKIEVNLLTLLINCRRQAMYQNYLVVDLHLKRTYVVLMDAQGKIRNPNGFILMEVKYLRTKEEFLRIA
jgi:hypothetical protein